MTFHVDLAYGQMDSPDVFYLSYETKHLVYSNFISNFGMMVKNE